MLVRSCIWRLGSANSKTMSVEPRSPCGLSTGLGFPTAWQPRRTQTSQSQKGKSFIPANKTATLPFATQLRKLCNVTPPPCFTGQHCLKSVKRRNIDSTTSRGQESENTEA